MIPGQVARIKAGSLVVAVSPIREDDEDYYGPLLPWLSSWHIGKTSGAHRIHDIKGGIAKFRVGNEEWHTATKNLEIL